MSPSDLTPTIYVSLSVGGYTPECNIIALVFINRITAVHTLPLTMLNWRSLWLVAIILAQKVWDDRPLKTSAFVHIIPAYTKKLLRDLELNALQLLQYLTNVKPSLYARYYFELRELFTEIMGFQQVYVCIYGELCVFGGLCMGLCVCIYMVLYLYIYIYVYVKLPYIYLHT